MEETNQNTAAEKNDTQKKPVFLIVFAIITALASIGCIVAYNAIGSYVTEEGQVVEPFALMPLALMFGFIAAITLIIIVIRLISRSSKHKKSEAAE